MLILWSLNGALVNDSKIEEKSYLKALEAVGYFNFDFPYFEGNPPEEIFKKLGFGRTIIQILSEKQNYYFNHFIESAPFHKDALASIELLHFEKIKQGIISSYPYETTKKTLQYHKIFDILPIYVSADSSIKPKPHVDYWTYVIHQSKTNVADIILIENNLESAISAQKSGISTIFLIDRNKEPNASKKSIQVVQNIQQIFNFLPTEISIKLNNTKD